MQNESPRKAPIGLPTVLGVVGQSPDAAVATLGQYVLLLWRRSIASEAIPWLREGFEKVSRQPPGRLVFLTAVEPGCNVMTGSDVRKKIAELLANYERQIACAAIVFEGDGFGMTFVRSVITAINLASRSRFPNSVFRKLEVALSWMELKLTAEPDRITIEENRVTDAINLMRVLRR